MRKSNAQYKLWHKGIIQHVKILEENGERKFYYSGKHFTEDKNYKLKDVNYPEFEMEFKDLTLSSIRVFVNPIDLLAELASLYWK